MIRILILLLGLLAVGCGQTGDLWIDAVEEGLATVVLEGSSWTLPSSSLEEACSEGSLAICTARLCTCSNLRPSAPARDALLGSFTL
jgi:hypothetical protein